MTGLNHSQFRPALSAYQSSSSVRHVKLIKYKFKDDKRAERALKQHVYSSDDKLEKLFHFTSDFIQPLSAERLQKMTEAKTERLKVKHKNWIKIEKHTRS